jgi:hypothetical protein
MTSDGAASGILSKLSDLMHSRLPALRPFFVSRRQGRPFLVHSVDFD